MSGGLQFQTTGGINLNHTKTFLRVQAILCIALALLLILSVMDICRDEEGFTAQRVMQHLRALAPLFFLSIGFTTAGLLLGAGSGRHEQPDPDAKIIRDLVCARIARPSKAIQAERDRQKLIRWSGTGLSVACTVPVVLYLLTPSHFDSLDLDFMLKNTLLHTLPWIILCLGSLSISDLLIDRSMIRETREARELLRDGTDPTALRSIRHKDTSAGRGAKILRIFFLIFSLMLILHGTLNGSMRDVFVKAIQICTECIGLG
mgnify:CR=1 FL=1